MATAFAEGEVFGRDLAIMVKSAIAEAIDPLNAENAALRARCEALEEIAKKTPEIDLMGIKKLIEDEISALPEAPKQIEREEVVEMVAEAVAQLPPPQKGEAGEKGEKGDTGERGVDGADGRDGLSVKGMLVDRAGHLRCVMADGTDYDLGEVVGKDGSDGADGADGAPGNDGRDGFGFDDMDACVLSDDRTIELSFRRGDEEKCFTFKWPTPVYRGVFKQGEQYEPGDLVTWGGSLHHCNAATTEKPDSGPWQVAAKKGRDGKDARG